ncbi:MAG TPA: prolipoprotein diacylglyceryl transferase family protein [Kofleriaceae bacterium]
MYALALALGGATAALPYFHLGALDVGIPIQAFGVIVAIGVLIGAGVLRRYAEWHGIPDDHIRGITGWVTVTGFIGAHVFDVLFYQWDKLEQDPLLIVKLWEGISSYGGFIGGALGWWLYVWWKRLPVRVMADVTILGLLVAFSIGRIGCTVVSDHIGAAVDPSKWYAMLAMEYPRHLGGLAEHYTEITTPTITAWNLGLLELLYLIPVNIFILWYAFRPAKPDGEDKDGKPKWISQHNAGMATALTGLLYAPVRFFMDYLRFSPEHDPRYLGLTFAQWISIVAFGAAIALVLKIKKNGAPYPAVGRTAGDVQRALKTILKEDEAKADKSDDKADKKEDKAELPKAVAKDKAAADDDALAKEAEAAGEGDEEGDEEDEDEKPATAAKPAGNRPRPGGGSSKKKKKKRR